MEFYAGDAGVIGRHFATYDWDPLRELVVVTGYVDFPLHFPMEYFDQLTQEISDTLSCNVPDFNDCLSDQMWGDGSEYAARIVAPECVDLLGTIGAEMPVEDVADAWVATVHDVHGDAYLWVTSELCDALAKLGKLCRESIAGNREVVFCWYL